jgi:branched-chain amino acid transport system permease protein
MDFLNAFILISNFIIVPAITYGSQLALGAIGVTLIYGVLRFANFAYGDLMAFGTMIVILFTWYLQSNGITLGFLPTAILAIPIGIIFTVAISLFFDKTVFEYYREKKSNPVTFIVVSLGIMFVLNAVVRIIIGPNDINFMDGHKFVIKASEFKKLTGLDEGLAIKSTQVITLITTIISCSLLFYFLNKTKTGKSMRAYSNNEDLALLSGINPKKIIIITWVIVSILATIAGTLYGLDKSFKPFTYFNNLLPIFAATIVGGIGNPLGAFYGGFLIAFSEIALTYAYKKFLGYLLPESLEPNTLIQFISTDYKFAISFAILVIVLIFRPNGIFKGKVI